MSNSTASDLAALPGLTGAKKIALRLASGQTNVRSVLFYGAKGSGTDELARILTKAWLCRKPGEDGACGECQACNAFERERSADFLMVKPWGPSRMIKVAAFNAQVPAKPDDPDPPAFEFIRTMPLSAQNRVVWIADAERMNAQTGNALLKNLEEPPDHGRFILTTTSVGSMLPTILSRSLAIACEVAGDRVGETWIVNAAAGAPGRIREIEAHQDAYGPVAHLAVQLPNIPRANALEVSERFAGLADAIQQRTGSNARTADADALEVLANVYGELPEHDPESLLAIVDAHRRIVGNAGASLVFDALFAQILR